VNLQGDAEKAQHILCVFSQSWFYRSVHRRLTLPVSGQTSLTVSAESYRFHVFSVFYRAMLCIRGTNHGPVSVCLCLCLSQAGVLLKRQNVGSQKNNITRYHRDSSFLTPRIAAKFDRGQHLRGRQVQVGWVKIGDFRQITGYISKTVQDRRMVSIKVE